MLPFFLLLLLPPCALAAPQHADPIHIPLVRRSTIPTASLPQIMDSVRLKYGFSPVNQKRSTTSTSITDEVRLCRIFLASHSRLAAKRFQLFRRREHRNTVRPPLTPLFFSVNSFTALSNSTSFSILASFHFALRSKRFSSLPRLFRSMGRHHSMYLLHLRRAAL